MGSWVSQLGRMTSLVHESRPVRMFASQRAAVAGEVLADHQPGVLMSLRERIEAGLQPDEFVFDPGDFLQLKIQIEQGNHPVCPWCGARLQCALTPEAAKASGNPPGVFCPTNLSHCQIAISFPRA